MSRVASTSHWLTRRRFLERTAAICSAAVLPFLGGRLEAEPPQSSAHSPEHLALGTPVPVRVGEVIQETRADFAAGQAQGVGLPRTGGASGLTAGPDGGVFISPVLATEFPAGHVGLHWVGTGGNISFELMTSRDGARWSRWHRVLIEAGKDDTPRQETFGALIGAQAARFLQYRATFPGGPGAVELSRVTLTYLDARPNGRATVGQPLRQAQDRPLRQAQESSELLSSLLAGPADFRSQIIPREDWGADESLRFKEDGTEVWPRAYVPAKKVVVHHTATENDYADGAVVVRAIYTYHAQTLGWGDIGYHLLIDNTGRVYEGRRGRERDPETGNGREIASRDVVGGHVTNHNFGSTGIALIGNFEETPLPTLMRERLEEALAFECARHGVDPLGDSDFLLQNDLWRDDQPDVPGHRDATPIECPGEFVYSQLPDLRRSVAARLALADRPRSGPVTLEQGRDPWPGPLSFFWRGPPGAQFSTFLEGWFRLPGQDEIFELSGYEPGTSLPAWGPWSNDTAASFHVSPEAHGHYTLHVRARTAPGVESVVWSRVTGLVEPQVAADNADPALTRAEGEWASDIHPRQYYGRDYAYSPPGYGESVFHWLLRAPRTGRYAVQACWISLDNLATAALFSIAVDGSPMTEVKVDQTRNPFDWHTLAQLDLTAGQTCEVSLSNHADGPVVADAVRLLLV